MSVPRLQPEGTEKTFTDEGLMLIVDCRHYRMSILLLILLVGVASSKHFGRHGNTETSQPIVTASESRRICAALCTSGLGGKTCGDDCLDIIPSSLPVQSVNSSRDNGTKSAARTTVCPVLCANQLGYPLCNCSNTTTNVNKDIDFIQICGYVCINLSYRINGCQNCDVYHQAVKTNGTNSFSVSTDRSSARSIDWEEWCRQMCAIGDGGAACNCDILPLSLPIN